MRRPLIFKLLFARSRPLRHVRRQSRAVRADPHVPGPCILSDGTRCGLRGQRPGASRRPGAEEAGQSHGEVRPERAAEETRAGRVDHRAAERAVRLRGRYNCMRICTSSDTSARASTQMHSCTHLSLGASIVRICYLTYILSGPLLRCLHASAHSTILTAELTLTLCITLCSCKVST